VWLVMVAVAVVVVAKALKSLLVLDFYGIFAYDRTLCFRFAVLTVLSSNCLAMSRFPLIKDADYRL
jgi:hypothetical protein